jgi:23S rRNA pseudouridine2605 synthase
VTKGSGGSGQSFITLFSILPAPASLTSVPLKPGQRPLKTLERILSKAGLCSRTDARKWIGAGRVKVNGKLIQTPDHWVDFERDKVTLDDQPVRHAQKIYLLLNKPKGYITTYKDPEGRPTVYDLIQDREHRGAEDKAQWVVPVGRLDQDTSGLLLLTNDTQFAERVTNPDFKIPKTYLVKAATLLQDAQLDRLRHGVVLSDGPTQPAVVKRVRDSTRHTFLEITIREGRNRQVRRMIEAVDSKVLKLVRIEIGSLRIGDLPIGKYRELTPGEVRLLMPPRPASPKNQARPRSRRSIRSA